MNKNKKRGVVLIYVLFLVTLSIVFATILLNNNAYLFNDSEFFEIDSKLYSNIKSDWKILVDINREVNLNWWGFTDNITCPTWTSIIMSWTTLRSDIWSTLFHDEVNTYCSATYQSQSLKIYFNTLFTDFVEADYSGSLVWLNLWLWNTNFSDSDSTLIDFSAFNYNVADWYDDNFNSDNYKVTSTWSTSTGTYYLDSYQDDDVLWRKIIFWYAAPDFWFKKVFWNTSKTSKIINDNINNNDSLNIKIWNVGTWVLYLDVDKSFDIKLLKLNKIIHDETNELSILEGLKWTMWAWIGYLQNNAWTLSLSGSITWSEYSFDFINNDYAILLKSTWTWTLLYKIKWETSTWTGIYIVPINDSDKDIIKYVWNEILIWNDWIFISKEIDIIYKK